MSLVVLVFMIQLCTVYPAPLNMNLLPFNSAFQHYSQLQKQLMELQAPQPWRPQVPFYPMADPLIILLPYNRFSNRETNDITNKRINDRVDNEFNNDKKEEDDTDAVVINAEPMPTIGEPQNQFMLLPNARLSLGDIISAIPFLPIEINVPDTISWMYNGIANGISGIISIIGQSRPFLRPTQQEIMKLKSNQVPISNMNRPIILIPMHAPVPF